MQPDQAHGTNGGPGTLAQMRRGSSIIGGLCTSLSLMLSRARFVITPYANETEVERRSRELAISYLGLDGTIGLLNGGFESLLTSLSEAVLVGTSVNRMRWDVVEWRGELVRVPVDVDYTHPGSIKRWLFDEREQIAGFVQRNPNTKKEVEIPADRLFHPRFLALANDPWGVGLLRACYAVYLHKSDLRQLYMEALSCLINGQFEIKDPRPTDGTGSAPEGKDFENEVARLEGVLADVIMGERAGWTTPHFLTVERHYPARELPNPTADIQACNAEIRDAFLTAIAYVGATPGQERPVFNGLRKIGEWMSDNVVRGLIWPMMVANFGADHSTRLPRLMPCRVVDRDPKDEMDVLDKATNRRLLTALVEDELDMRARFGMHIPERERLIEERRLAVTVGAMTSTSGADPSAIAAPSQDKIDGRATGEGEDVTAPVPDATPATPEEAPVADEALNGAQIASLVAIIQSANDGLLTSAQAEATIRAAFPGVSDTLIGRIVADIGKAKGASDATQ